jgi:hypothetical protein
MFDVKILLSSLPLLMLIKHFYIIKLALKRLITHGSKKMVNLKLRENKKDESDADTIEKYSRNFCFHNNGNEI